MLNLKRFFPEFDTPETIAYKKGNEIIVMSRYHEGVEANPARFESLNQEQKNQLAVAALVFGLGDINRGNILFGHGKPLLIDFEHLNRDGPLQLTSTDAQKLRSDRKAPFIDLRNPNDMTPYLQERGRWERRFNDPEFVKELQAVMEHSGLSPPEIESYLYVLRENVRKENFERNLGRIISPEPSMAPGAAGERPKTAENTGNGNAENAGPAPKGSEPRAPTGAGQILGRLYDGIRSYFGRGAQSKTADGTQIDDAAE